MRRTGKDHMGGMRRAFCVDTSRRRETLGGRIMRTFAAHLLSTLTAVAALTAAPAASAAPWTFAIFCDGRTSIGEAGGKDGVNVTAVSAIAADVASQKVSLVVFPGDLVNGGAEYGPFAQQLETWKHAMAPLYQAGIPVYVCRGNHELKQDRPKGNSAAVFRSAFPELPRNGPAGQEGLTYEVDHENAAFIAIDQFAGISPTFDKKTYDSTTNYGMVSPWVIERVRASHARWVFAFGHESAFIGHHADCLASAPAERDALWDALGARGGVYISGHDHMYVRHTAPDIAHHPVLELVVGCAGATPYPYDNAAMNAKLDRLAVPVDEFVNAKAGGVPNTNRLPMYFGYVLITVDGDELHGAWRAFTNYDTTTFTGPKPPEEPRFETLDRFSWH